MPRDGAITFDDFRSRLRRIEDYRFDCRDAHRIYLAVQGKGPFPYSMQQSII